MGGGVDKEGTNIFPVQQKRVGEKQSANRGCSTKSTVSKHILRKQCGLYFFISLPNYVFLKRKQRISLTSD
jgi:hypothetical protein